MSALQTDRGKRMRRGCEVFIGSACEKILIDRRGLFEIRKAGRWFLAIDSPSELQEAPSQHRQSGARLLASQRPCLGD
ncbi:hypothetical protein ABZ614_08175 [Streptomyces sp. NPDC013178]|uniref:hypothetical protein n=1 Tax=Streptomyces sp. NPDC013178 TaxID=3155118 RepID=UPI0033C17CBB